MQGPYLVVPFDENSAIVGLFNFPRLKKHGIDLNVLGCAEVQQRYVVSPWLVYGYATLFPFWSKVKSSESSCSQGVY